MRSHAILVLVSVIGCTAGDGSLGPDAGDDGQPADASSGGGGDASPPHVIDILGGVDRASAFTVAEAKSLKTNHGVKWTGVYIGGPCSAGSGWTKSLVTSFAD